MNIGIISGRYAKALLELSRLSGRGEQDCAQALALLEHPERTPKHLEKDLQALTELLIKNGRLPYVKFILRSFVKLYRQANGIVDIQLTTAVPVPGIEDKFRRLIPKELGDKLSFHTSTNPYLIGGFVLTIDENMLDGSVRSQLDKVGRALEEMNKRIV